MLIDISVLSIFIIDIMKDEPKLDSTQILSQNI